MLHGPIQKQKLLAKPRLINLLGDDHGQQRRRVPVNLRGRLGRELSSLRALRTLLLRASLRWCLRLLVIVSFSFSVSVSVSVSTESVLRFTARRVR